VLFFLALTCSVPWHSFSSYLLSNNDIMILLQVNTWASLCLFAITSICVVIRIFKRKRNKQNK
jgi:hypothetical protein